MTKLRGFAASREFSAQGGDRASREEREDAKGTASTHDQASRASRLRVSFQHRGVIEPHAEVREGALQVPGQIFAASRLRVR